MQFLVLGPLEVTAGGGTVRLPAAKHRALLAALLVRANQAVSADGLIEALWDGQPPASAAKTLQTYVSQLRRELEPTAAAGDWRVLRTADGGYRLHNRRYPGDRIAIEVHGTFRISSQLSDERISRAALPISRAGRRLAGIC